MIKVIHFDRDRFFSHDVRKEFAEIFSRHKNVDYYDFMSDHYGEFEENREELESLLPNKDVLLIHPGMGGQKRIFEYPQMFPNLRVALVIPGSFSDYEKINGIARFSYDHKRAIERFVLEEITA